MNTIVVVIVMQGCPACHEYLPTVQQAAARHPRVQVHVIDAGSGDPNVKALVERYNVNLTPTTLVLRRPSGFVKSEGALDPGQLESLMQLAERYG